MKSLVPVLLLQLLTLSLNAASPAGECSLCVGTRSDLVAAPASPIPLLVETTLSELSTLAAGVDALTPQQRKQTVVLVQYAIEPGRDPLLDIESKTSTIVEWARLHGPFDALAAVVQDHDPAVVSYAIKRLAVTAQGAGAAGSIAVARTQAEELQGLFEHGAQSYFDALIVEGDPGRISETAAYLAANDPAKKIYAVVTPHSFNPLFDLAQALSLGATRAYLAGDGSDTKALAGFNHALAGDFAFDPTSSTAILDSKGNRTSGAVLTFVRGEDLRALVVPQGDPAAPIIVAISSDQFEKPRRIDAAGERLISDTGTKGGRLLVGVQPSPGPYAIALDRAVQPQKNVTREAMDVATERGITVEEIIRNHQAYQSYQESVRPRYIARDTTKLRFDIGGGAEAIEATIEGDYFADARNQKADWIWQDFYINGVKWKYGRIPELPLIQPEKVTQLPLDIHLTDEYRYTLVRQTDLGGYHTYEVRFEPPPDARAALPLYRGTVWIDARTWARIRITMVQLNLTGEVLSNEERVDFQPFERDSGQVLAVVDATTGDARSLLWLQREVAAQQVVSAAGRANVVLRSTTFTDFRIDPADFEARLAQASRSDARMVRETQAGLRYLEKRGDERVVKEGFDTSRTFMLGGIHHDAGLQYPIVPLGGIDYFNFNLGGRGIQTNVFFAGILLAANATSPSVRNTRFNAGADFFGIAIPTESSLFRGGIEQKGEAVKVLPTSLTLRAGHPFLQFGKVDLSLATSHRTYQRAEDTAPRFIVPSDNFEIGSSLDARYARWGYSLSAFYDWRRRTTWKPWGNLDEYDARQKSYATFGATVGKSFYLPKFQRISVDINYLDGQRLDRFSKYELGFFGAQRIHGIESGSVRAEQAILGHLSYGFVFSEQFRIEAFYDQGLLHDVTAGYRREPFQGLGLAGQTVGPYGTLLRLDIGKTVGRNAQGGFVANVVFLKLF